MPALIHMVFCNAVVVDSQTNNVSIQGLIEEMQVRRDVLERSLTENAAAGGQMAVYALFSRVWPSSDDGAAFTVHLKLRAPSDEVVELGAVLADSPGSERVRVIFNVLGIPLRGEGIYTFELHLDGVGQAGAIPFTVKPLDLESLGATAAPSFSNA